MDFGSKGKILLGSRGNYFQGSGEINALFSGIKGAQTPLGGLITAHSLHHVFLPCVYNSKAVLVFSSFFSLLSIYSAGR